MRSRIEKGVWMNEPLDFYIAGWNGKAEKDWLEGDGEALQRFSDQLIHTIHTIYLHVIAMSMNLKDHLVQTAMRNLQFIAPSALKKTGQSINQSIIAKSSNGWAYRFADLSSIIPTQKVKGLV